MGGTGYNPLAPPWVPGAGGEQGAGGGGHEHDHDHDQHDEYDLGFGARPLHLRLSTFVAPFMVNMYVLVQSAKGVHLVLTRGRALGFYMFVCFPPSLPLSLALSCSLSLALFLAIAQSAVPELTGHY